MDIDEEIDDAAAFVAEYGGDLEKIAEEIATIHPGKRLVSSIIKDLKLRIEGIKNAKTLEDF